MREGKETISDSPIAGQGSDQTRNEPEKETFESIRDPGTIQDDGFRVPSGCVPFKKPSHSSRVEKSVVQDQEMVSITKEDNMESEDKSQSEIIFQKKSPAQQLVEKSQPIPYKEPTWSGLPQAEYSFEVLKNGMIVETIPLRRPYSVIGRLAQCDIVMEHPSLSRFHCVIQYRLESSDDQPRGFYAYDLGSTHGSFHNKHQMKPHTYYRLNVGHMLKLGGSTRMLILQGPEEDMEPESDLSVTELKAAAAEKTKKLADLEAGEEGEWKTKTNTEKDTKPGDTDDTDGINWGMREDAEEEEEEGEGAENPFASLNEELYLEDPKKTLRGWFEREGYEFPEYEVEDVSPGCYKCRVELPVPGLGGGPLVVIVEHRGKKKAAVLQCALEACRHLDRRGVLRQSKHESHERKAKNWAENDYYDSDEDDFLDRTGDVQRKRMRRMKNSDGRDSGSVETFDTLNRKYNEVIEELSAVEEKLSMAERLKQAAEGNEKDEEEEEEEDLDVFMQKLKSQVPDKHKRVSWKLRAVELRKDELRLRRLANVARPHNVPEIQPYQPKIGSIGSSIRKQPVATGGTTNIFTGSGSAVRQLKEPTFQVHKAFLDEDPEPKLKLRRLDDDDDERVRPAPYSVSKTDKRHLGDIRKPESYLKEPPEKHKINSEAQGPLSASTAQNKESSNSRNVMKGPMLPPEYSVPKSRNKLIACNVIKEPMLPPVNTWKKDVGDDSVDSSRDRDRYDVRKNIDLVDSSSASESPLKTMPSKENESEYTSSEKDKEDSSPADKKLRFVGPKLPPDLVQVAGRNQESTKKHKHVKKHKRYDDEDPNYDKWVPPVHQTGDGRTSLNDKLGY